MAKRKKQRSDGEGTLFKRKSDGRWVARVTSVGPDGRLKVRSKTAQTEADGLANLTILKNARSALRQVTADKGTVGTWIDLWIEQYIRPPKKSPSTYVGYSRVLKNCLPDYIRRIPLRKLPDTADLFDRLFSQVAEEHGGRSAELLRAILRSAFNKAKKKDKLSKNPILDTDPVQYVRSKASTFTPDQATRFIQAAEDDRLGCLFLIALTLGLRKGEVSGLKASDIDLEERTLRVRRTLAWIKLPGDEYGRWIEKPPKQESTRDLPITETIYRNVVRHLVRREAEAASTKSWKDSGYLFTSVTGAPLHERNLTEAFRRVCARANVPVIRFHDTRHTAGMMLHAEGASPFTIQAVLGHTQLSTTKRYTDAPMEVKRLAFDRVDSRYRENAPAKPENETQPQPVTGKRLAFVETAHSAAPGNARTS